jgi:hypothetical protein
MVPEEFGHPRPNSGSEMFVNFRERGVNIRSALGLSNHEFECYPGDCAEA